MADKKIFCSADEYAWCEKCLKSARRALEFAQKSFDRAGGRQRGSRESEESRSRSGGHAPALNQIREGIFPIPFQNGYSPVLREMIVCRAGLILQVEIQSGCWKRVICASNEPSAVFAFARII